MTNSHHIKEVHIIGGGLFGCLLAYQLSKKKIKISIFERSNELLNSFNSIELNKIKLNNGFHGIEFPRAKKLYNFFKDKLKVKFNTFEINRKIIFKKYIINYTDKKSEWPNQISSYLKNTNVPYKNQKINFFFKKKIINLFKQNSLKYTNNTINDKSFFLPWFLPADIKHLSNDEGDKFRSLIRTKKIRGKVMLPASHTFSVIKKKMYDFLISKNIKIYFNTKVSFQNQKMNYFTNGNEIKFQKKNIKKTFFCLSSAFLIQDLSKKHFSNIKKNKKYGINCLIRINNKNKLLKNFSEILPLNRKIYYINRIYSLNYFGYKKKDNFLVLEIIKKNKLFSKKLQENMLEEIKNIFNLKSKPKILEYKITREIYQPDKKWITTSKKILINKIKKNYNIIYTNDFYPINMNKAWINSIKYSKNI